MKFSGFHKKKKDFHEHISQTVHGLGWELLYLVYIIGICRHFN